MKLIKVYSLLAVAIYSGVFSDVYAQLPDNVGSLINADRTASNVAKRENPHEALISIVDKESTLYVPSPVNALTYLNNRPNIPDVMSWNPNFALVSKSLDWGVTSGPMEFQKVGAIKRYGQYLTVWRRDRKGNWKVHIRAEGENFGKGPKSDLVFRSEERRVGK